MKVRQGNLTQVKQKTIRFTYTRAPYRYLQAYLILANKILARAKTNTHNTIIAELLRRKLQTGTRDCSRLFGIRTGMKIAQ